MRCVTSAWILAYISDLGAVCLAAGGPPPLPKTKDGANISVKSSTATPQPQRRTTEKGPPVPSRNMIRQLLLATSFNVSQEVCFTPGSTASHAANTSIRSAGTTPLVQKQRPVFFSDFARCEKVLGFADVIVTDGADHGARPDLVERVVPERSAPDTAFVQPDVEEPCHAGFRPASARRLPSAAHRTWHGSHVSQKNTNAF